MRFVKTFKGYEDKLGQLDAEVNHWLIAHKANVIDLRTALSHEPGSRSGSGDLIYTIVYESEAPLG